MTPVEQRLNEIVDAAQALFPDLDALSPGGILHLAIPPVTVDRLRIELGTTTILQVRALGLTTADAASPTELAARSTITVGDPDDNLAVDAEALFDVDSAVGPKIRTRRVDHPWLEVTFDSPLELAGVHLRSVERQAPAELRHLVLSAGSSGEAMRVLHDAPVRALELQRLLDTLATTSHPDVQEHLPALMTVAGHVLTGRYAEARATMKALRKQVPLDHQYEFRRAVNRNLLISRELEWTAHGVQRSFRFWDDTEKRDYVQSAVDLAHDLTDLTSSVSFGFGAALAVVRDGDLIPHDDDLDLIVGFEADEATTLPEAHVLVEDHLRERGYTVTGDFFGHRHVHRPGRRSLDVFVALFEGDKVAWYPGKRRSLDRDTMFPTSTGHLLGIACPLPRNPLIYLETVYGSSWRNPDPTFKHTWRRKKYADQSGEAPVPVAAPAPEPEVTPPTPPSTGWRSRLRRGN